MKSLVTTKRGDDGQSSSLGGERVSKAHPIMECTGTLDELRAVTALARQCLLREQPRGYTENAEFLEWLVHVYFLIGAACSDPVNARRGLHQHELRADHLERLEREQIRLEEALNLPRRFIAGASTLSAAHTDLACTVARRFERAVVALREAVPEFECALMLQFVNRLSDYLFVLARFCEDGRHEAVDYGKADP